MTKNSFFILNIVSFALFNFIGCNSYDVGNYDSLAYRPSNPNKVRVKYPYRNSAIYVLEEDKPLLITATCIGKNESPTPLGFSRAYNKLPRKRSNTYGFHVTSESYGEKDMTPKVLGMWDIQCLVRLSLNLDTVFIVVMFTLCLKRLWMFKN